MRQTDRLFNVVLSGSELYEKTRAFVTKMLKIARFGTKFFISRKTFFIFVITEEKFTSDENSATDGFAAHDSAIKR